MFENDLNIQRLEVKFESSTERQKVLYANGRMQVRVLVLVSGENAQAEEVSLHGHPALETLKLISYNTSAPLGGDWNVDAQENRYAHDIAGGTARVMPLVPAVGNRLSDPSESIQVFEFWVTCRRPGSIQIAAEITLEGKKYRSNGFEGHDSSVSLQAIAPKLYPVSNFMLNRTRVLDSPSLFEKVEQYSLVLYGEGRQINLLDWKSLQVKYDAEFATEFFSSGDATKVSSGLKSYVGYIAPIYGAQVTARTSQGFRTVSQDPGTISIISYLTAEHPNKPERTGQVDLHVFDEFGTEHIIRISPDIANRTYKIS
ncbi:MULTISPECIES: hypothetical protein [Pseudomonas]|uniref:Uncharacterized protein n=1 Tax=Pseudomonas aphyarum TaxID=2942629 RepID=A0ABT5PUW6_9PSED|nr:hypothetical protein [Pseudomonas aphyarum]MDD0968103.1 hypothetical protein [Pseudomonas aphyarum]MDD1127565.1 hypothetical protein [Pseudomonas aphyarum]